MLVAAALAAGNQERGQKPGLGGAHSIRHGTVRLGVSGIPEPARQGLAIGAPEPLRDDQHVERWAALRRGVVARVAPSTRARPAARLSARTPERTTNLVLVLGHARDARGRLWIRARLPSREARTGWLPRAALGTYGAVHTRLIVDRARFRLTLVRDGRVVLKARVGVGRASTPTPAGSLLRTGGLRHERALGDAHRLAGRWLRRDPRHQPPRPRPGADLARLHPSAQRGHRAPRGPAAGRHPTRDPLSSLPTQ
jgi:L,D-transpeptidase-like protein